MHTRQNAILATLNVLELSAAAHSGTSAGIVIGNECFLRTRKTLLFHKRKGKLAQKLPLNHIFDDSY